MRVPFLCPRRLFIPLGSRTAIVHRYKTVVAVATRGTSGEERPHRKYLELLAQCDHRLHLTQHRLENSNNFTYTSVSKSHAPKEQQRTVVRAARRLARHILHKDMVTHVPHAPRRDYRRLRRVPRRKR